MTEEGRCIGRAPGGTVARPIATSKLSTCFQKNFQAFHEAATPEVLVNFVHDG